MISRTPEHQEAREASIQEASSVYDMLSIGMARRGQYAMLSQVRLVQSSRKPANVVLNIDPTTIWK